MIKIVNIFTGLGGLIDYIGNTFRSTFGECEITNIVDDGILNLIIQKDDITEDIAQRVDFLLKAAQMADPDLIICTCSSVGEVAEDAAKHSTVPIMRIDEPMVRQALTISDRIAVMGTLKTTMNPTCRLVERLALEMGKSVVIEQVLMPEVTPALRAGKLDEALNLVKASAQEIQKNNGVLLMAQASLGMLRESLQPLVSIPVLASTPLCANYIRDNYL